MGWITMPKCQAGISEAFPEGYDSHGFGDECSSRVMNQVEVSIISAQDVVSRRGRSAQRCGAMEESDGVMMMMKKKKKEQQRRRQAYMAVAWIHPQKKMRTHVAACHEQQQPTWNAKLHFLVPEDCLHEDSSSALTIQIFCHGTFTASLVGTARVLLSKFVSKRGKGYEGAQSMALQIRRPSGRPQGILNIGAMVLNHDDYHPHLLPLMPTHLDLIANTALNHTPDQPLSLLNSPPNYHHYRPNQQAKSSSTLKETCRKSFSTSRDYIHNDQELLTYSRYSSARLSLDYCNYTSEGLEGFELKSLDSNCYEEEEEEEEEEEDGHEEEEKEKDEAEFSINNMEAIYRKLKQCKLIDSGVGINDDDDDDANQIGLIHEPVKPDDGLADALPNLNGVTNSDGLVKSDGINQTDSIASANYDEDHRMHLFYDKSYECMENAAKIREDKNVIVIRCKGEWNVMNHHHPQEEKGSGGGISVANDVKAKDRTKGLARGISWAALRTKGAARIHRSPSDKP